jgi:AraC-like DNA-binding protein
MKLVLSLPFQIADVPCKLVFVNPRNEQQPKDANVLQHRHPGLEIHCVRAGEIEIDTAVGNFKATKGDMLVLPSGMYHYVRKVSPDAYRTDLLIEIGSYTNSNDAQAKHFLKSLVFSKPLLSRSVAQPKLFAALDRICSVAPECAEDFAQREMLKALCVEFVLLLGIAAVTIAEPEQVVYESEETARDRYIMDEFFNHNYHGNRDMEALARQLNISVRQLGRELQRAYGKSFREKMNECRLAVAVDLLQNTTKSMAEIAEILGYSNPVNFSSFVKHQTGRSPSQIRKARDLQ